MVKVLEKNDQPKTSDRTPTTPGIDESATPSTETATVDKSIEYPQENTENEPAVEESVVAEEVEVVSSAISKPLGESQC